VVDQYLGDKPLDAISRSLVDRITDAKLALKLISNGAARMVVSRLSRLRA